jgi:hypothetical protein
LAFSAYFRRQAVFVKPHSHRFPYRAHCAGATAFSDPPAAMAGAESATLDHFLFGPRPTPEFDASPRPRRAAGEIWLSACEAIALSPRGHAAAAQAHAEIFSRSGRPLPDWFTDLRRRLSALCAAPGCETVLAANDDAAEQIFDALAQAALPRPVLHVAAGAPDSALAALPLRDRYGLPRDMAQVDAEAERLVGAAVAQGKDVALHVTDCSGTGLAGPSRALAAALAESHPGRVLVLVDARQMRCEARQLAMDLAAGFAILASGSRFAGAPAGAAALLLPASLCDRIGSFDLPDAVAAQSAAMDWPPALRERRRGEFAALADLGLGLRWESALAELESLFAIEAGLRARIEAAFARDVSRHLAAAPGLRLTDCCWLSEDARKIFPILTFDERGRPLKAERLHQALADPARRRGGRAARGRAVHLGAPLRIGAMKALRLSLSAPLLNDVAERMRDGRAFAAAFQPLADDLLEAFALWSELAAADGA